MKLNIITINLNNARGLKNTLASIIAQDFVDYELLVIDGGSNDGSLEIIKANARNIFYWISEEDKGVYHAMNKGIEKATGDYLLFLNSGDILCHSSILQKVFEEKRNEDIIYGDLVVNDNGKKWIKKYPDLLTFDYFYKDTLPHPSTFIKKELFNKVGIYNEGNKIVSDWEFFIIAIAKYNCSYKHLPFCLAEFGFDGISSRPENALIIEKEKKRVLEHHFYNFLLDYEELERLKCENKLLRNSKAFKFSRLIKKIRN